MRSKSFVVIFVAIVLMLTSCSNVEQGIRIGAVWEENRFEQIIDYIPVGDEVYIQYNHTESFNADTVELEIYKNNMIVSGGSAFVKNEDRSVIIPITIEEQGIYKARVYISEVEVYKTDIIAK